MKKILLLFIILFTFASAKKDFYYGFIGSSGEQILQKKKQDISDGFDILEQVLGLSKNGKVDEAYEQIVAFKEQNKIDLLKSDIIITYAQIALKKNSSRIALEASSELENAINSSIIQDTNLAKAYIFLVELKIRTNKLNEAKYFAQTIINNFDDNLTKAYGNIALAKVYKHKKSYKISINLLYEILIKTTNILIATIVADELFDIYVLDNQKDKAYELVSKVLMKNIEHYSKDSYLAVSKINKLIKANMPEFAVEILLKLLQQPIQEGAIEDFKYKLANTYMQMYDGTNYYLFKAKKLYKEILTFYPQTLYAKKIKMAIDEILMREKQIEPYVLTKRYPNSEVINQKVLLQELLNNKDDKEYDKILNSKKVYQSISNSIAQRFGYESLDVIFGEISLLRIKYLLEQSKCSELNQILQKTRIETLLNLAKNEETVSSFFACLIEVPNKNSYELLKNSFTSSRNATIYLYLEQIAFKLALYDDALGFSSKIDMVNDDEILSKEFLQRFLILITKKDTISMQKFFTYALKNEQYILNNLNNPLIIDFYYQFYLYLISKNENLKALDVLNKLYFKQKDFKARVYTPFVEVQLALYEKNEKNDKTKALGYFIDALNSKRRIKDNDLAQIYYELINLYDGFDNNNKRVEYIIKCKELKSAQNSLYKNMCDKMQ